MDNDLGAQKSVDASAGDQPLPKNERDLIDEAYGRLRVFREGCREMHRLAREARRIALLDDPYQDDLTGGDPKDPERRRVLQLNAMRSTLDNCVADQMDNMPEARMLPERADLAGVAEDMTDLVRYILTRNDYEALHRRRAEDFFITGSAVTQIGWDAEMGDGHGNVAVIRWPVEAFLWDPVAEDIQDARALIKVSWHPMSWYAAHYPEKARYVGGEPYAEEGVGVPDAWATKQSGDEDRALLMEYWYRRYDADTRRHTVSVAYIAGGALLDLVEDVYRHGLYPFVVDKHTHIEGLPVGVGLVHSFAPTQRLINSNYAYMDQASKWSSQPRLLVGEGSGIAGDTLTDWRKNVIKGNSIGPDMVQWLPPYPPSQTIMAIAMQLEAGMKLDSGQNDFQRGGTTGGVTAASAIAALQEQGGKVTRMATHTLGRGFARIVEQVMWLIDEFYGPEEELQVTGRDDNPRTIKVGSAVLRGGLADDLPLPYRCQVQVQRRNPLRVQAQNDLVMQMATYCQETGMPILPAQLIDLLDVDGKDRVIPALEEAQARADTLAQMAQAMEAAQARITEQEQAIANLSQALSAQEPQGTEPQGVVNIGAVMDPDGMV